MMDVTGYEVLAGILEEAYDQAARGKGKERHANDLPWDNQPILNIGRSLPSVCDGEAYQVIKKTQEAMGMIARGELDKARHEMLGAINYAAACVALVKEAIAAKPLPPVPTKAIVDDILYLMRTNGGPMRENQIVDVVHARQKVERSHVYREIASLWNTGNILLSGTHANGERLFRLAPVSKPSPMSADERVEAIERHERLHERLKPTSESKPTDVAAYGGRVDAIIKAIHKVLSEPSTPMERSEGLMRSTLVNGVMNLTGVRDAKVIREWVNFELGRGNIEASGKNQRLRLKPTSKGRK
jgi:hypothetical protein